MKRNIILRVAFLLATTFFMITCTKSDIEKAREAYDPSQVIPVVQGITGAASVLQTKTFDYTVNYFRAGSTWSWTGVDCTIQSVSEDTRTATVLFSVLPAGGAKAKIQVTETTAGGKTSGMVEKEAVVNPFCPLAIADFAGQWTCVETGHDPRTSTATLVQGTGDEIIIKVQAGIPGLFGDLFIGWGETFQPGFGLLGDVVLHVNTDNGIVTIKREYWGQTLPGPYDYEYAATTGNWSNCGASAVITIPAFTIVDFPASYTQSIVLTKQ